ncbi:hypothetical protein EDC04DRAFT_339970 [Pisolithus marmoratus]|nr:hypothetical protein EDC04DRAFT_339970 [Pisolithus marmoratus]
MKSLRQCCGAGHSGQQRGNSHASGVPPFPVPSATAICMALIFKTLPFERRIRDIGHFRIWRFFTCVARKASGLTECDVQQCDFNSNEPVHQWNSQLRRTEVTNLYGIRLPQQGSLLALPQGGVCLHLLGTPCPHTVHNYKTRDPRYPGPSQTVNRKVLTHGTCRSGVFGHPLLHMSFHGPGCMDPDRSSGLSPHFLVDQPGLIELGVNWC